MNRYAVVDIETTGGYAAQHRIIEIAIIITDGQQVLARYESLVDPGQNIPYMITGLTGITNEDVERAPTFSQIAHKVFELLNDCVFVAHNVNFDFSFVRTELQQSGYLLNARKLCTVRLSRKIFPGFRSYSLGNLCGHLGIDISNRHRAMGDAYATFEVLQKLVSKDKDREIDKALKRNSFEQTLPPNLPKIQFENLPQEAGVYYFHNDKGKIIYVGKAVNIKKRVSSHFTSNMKGPQRQNFLRDIFSISYQLTGNELIALLLETDEIHHHWPEYNRAQKKQEFPYGIFDYVGMDGFIRLAIDSLKRHSKPVVKYDSLSEANAAMLSIANAFNLCLAKCSIGTRGPMVIQCKDDCLCKKGSKSYNKKASQALESLVEQQRSFAVLSNGRQADEVSFVLIEKGQYKGFGFAPADQFSAESLHEFLQPKKHYRFAASVISSFAERFSDEYRMLEV